MAKAKDQSFFLEGYRKHMKESMQIGDWDFDILVGAWIGVNSNGSSKA
jgi:hypothetical protein